MKYLSLFSGIGGFELGIQQAYETIRNIDVQKVGGRKKTPQRKLQGNGKRLHTISSKTTIPPANRNNELPNRSFDKGQPHCIGFSEIDKYAIQIYEKHFNHKNYGDIAKINPKELPDFDLLCGGFPCQAFSIAGKRQGFSDTRGTLFFEIIRVVGEKQPRLLLLENVKGLLSHDKGATFATILSSLDELGYDCQWQVLNSKNFGVPQNRERVFITGHLRRTPRPKVFPFGESDQEDIILPTITTRITANSNGTYVREKQTQRLKQIIGGQQGNRIYDPSGIATTIASQAGGQGAKTGLYAIPTPDRAEKRQNGRRMKADGEPMFTLTGQDKHGIYDGVKIRRLTPTECERLQGFPDGWTEGVSDTQRYKCLGNAVTVNVVREIIKKLI